MALAALLATSTPAFALTLEGNAEVVDSDMLMLGGYRVYLVGVESVEPKQTCTVNGQEWQCYPAALRMLQTIAEQAPLTCEVLSGPNFLKQATALCLSAGKDIGELFVRSGFGIVVPAETHAYDEAQKAAQDEKAGLWQGNFVSPEEWRQTQPFTAGRPAFKPAGE